MPGQTRPLGAGLLLSPPQRPARLLGRDQLLSGDLAAEGQRRHLTQVFSNQTTCLLKERRESFHKISRLITFGNLITCVDSNNSH